MGLCASGGELSEAELAERKQQKANARKVDNMLSRAKQKDEAVHKLLLLGAGESGKSTLFKQMVQIYGDGHQQADLELHRPIIYNNIITAIQTLCREAENYGGVDPSLADAQQRIMCLKEGDDVDADTGAAVKLLIQDKAVQSAYEHRSHFQLTDSAMYFFEKIDEVAAYGYVPSLDDFLRSRVPTTGIVEKRFTVNESVFEMYDVGGQRSERKKWIHCFENVTAVLFVCAMSAYDQVLYEDDQTNRMQESLKLYEEIANSHWFEDTAIILFLNKKDLFEQKLKSVPLNRYFPNYEGDNSYDDALDFIQQQFYATRNNKKNWYVHATCATDQDNVEKVFDDAKKIVIKKGLSRAGLM